MSGCVYLRGVGRPHVVYGRRCKPEQLEHEVWLTEAELLLAAEFTRDVPVGKTVADAAFVRDGTRFFVEVDNHSMRARQMREKWSRYGQVSDCYILVICHTKRRLRQLMRGAEPVRNVALFTLFRWLGSPRVTEPWIDYTRRRVRL